ncbi:MAG: hypothetical protein P8L49_11595 [Opitutaceae bacterium]|nr:hypothetical protein [Opitutaceae bacterium]
MQNQAKTLAIGNRSFGSKLIGDTVQFNSPNRYSLEIVKIIAGA